MQWNAQKIIYVNLPIEILTGDFSASQGGLFRLSPLRSDGSWNRQMGDGPQKWWRKADHQARVHTDQMVLVMVRPVAGPHERQSKTLKGELENNSGQPRDLVGKLA
jgi:hypothetical protein